MRRWVVVLSILLLSLSMFGCGSASNKQPEKVKVGIIQWAEHTALDAARQGFLETLKKNGYEEGKNLEVDFQNAQADASTASTIANQFVGQKVDLILAIATPAAQAVASKTSDIPILITAVTDPVAAGLVKSLEKPETNVTGTTDMNPIKEQLELLKQLVPSAKKVGVVYNTSEKNSEVQVNLAKSLGQEMGLSFVDAVATNTNEVLQAAQSLVGRVDAIYVPTDNTAVAAITSIVQVGEQHKIPVVVAEAGGVDKGALATIGIDYYRLGQQTGEMALRVIKGEKPASMAIEQQKDFQLVLNLKAAQAMGVKIPQELIDKADRVIK